MNLESSEKTASGSFEARAKFHDGKTEECTVRWKISYFQNPDGRYWMKGHKLKYEIEPHGRPKEYTHMFNALMFHRDIARAIQNGPESEKAVRQAISLNEDKVVFRFVNRSPRR